MYRILHVDDEPCFSDQLRKVLGDEFNVIAEETAKDGLARITAGEKFDCIISDGNLGAGMMNGWTFIRKVEDLLGDQCPPTFMLTRDFGDYAFTKYHLEDNPARIKKYVSEAIQKKAAQK